MISVKTFSPEINSMASSFIKNIYNFDIFYHFPQSEQSKSEVKKKNLSVPGELKYCLILHVFYMYCYIISEMILGVNSSEIEIESYFCKLLQFRSC